MQSAIQSYFFSTGDQETFTKSATVRTRVWSFNETRTNGVLVTKSNWVIPLENGVRVTGPVALFNGSRVLLDVYTHRNAAR